MHSAETEAETNLSQQPIQKNSSKCTSQLKIHVTNPQGSEIFRKTYFTGLIATACGDDAIRVFKEDTINVRAHHMFLHILNFLHVIQKK